MKKVIAKKSKRQSNESGVKSKASKVQHVGDGTAILTHSQSIKQSMNYQSAECVYGVQLTVEDTEEAIKRGFERAEEMIESPLVDKFTMQQETLSRLG